MKYTLLLTLLASAGCISKNNTIDEMIDPFDGPNKTIYIPSNVASTNKKWDGSKGKFPPGRIINYKGHGVDYTTGNSHINHHIHQHTHHGDGGLHYHND